MQQLLSRIVHGVYLAEVLASVLVQLSDLQSPPSALFRSLRIGEYFGEIAYESKYAVTCQLASSRRPPIWSGAFSQSAPRSPVEMSSGKRSSLMSKVF